MKKLVKNKKFLLIFGLLLAGGLFWGLKARSSKTLLKINPKQAQTFIVKRDDIEQSLTLAGKVDAQKYVVLQFQTSGKLAWVGVKERDRIKKWQAIASLDKAALQKQFQKTMNDYLTNRWNFEDTQDQYKETKNRFLITPELQRILDRQQYTLNNSVLDYEIANLAVKYATLISPLSGIVTGIENSTVGVNITPLNFSVTIIDPSSIYFKSEVDEEDVKYLSEKQNAIIILDSFSILVLVYVIFNSFTKNFR